MFRKLIWKIVKPEVFKEIKKSMEKFLPQLIGLVEKYGTKFLVALAGNYFVYDLANKDKIQGIYAAGIIGIISVMYFLMRRWQEVSKPKNGNGATPPGDNGNGGK